MSQEITIKVEILADSKKACSQFCAAMDDTYYCKLYHKLLKRSYSEDKGDGRGNVETILRCHRCKAENK